MQSSVLRQALGGEDDFGLEHLAGLPGRSPPSFRPQRASILPLAASHQIRPVALSDDKRRSNIAISTHQAPCTAPQLPASLAETIAATEDSLAETIATTEDNSVRGQTRMSRLLAIRTEREQCEVQDSHELRNLVIGY